MTSSSPLIMAIPFPVLFSAPIGVPDWVGDAAARAGSSMLHPRRVWVWETERDPDPHRDPERTLDRATSNAPARPPTQPQSQVLPRSVSLTSRAISERSSQPAFSIIERTHYSDVSSLPGPSGTNSRDRHRISPPSAWGSDFLSVPSPSLQTPATPTFPTALPVPPPRDPRDPLLGSIISMKPRTIDQPRSISEPRPLGKPDPNLLAAPELDDFCPAMSSTPRRPSAPAAASSQPASTPRRRGFSMASLSLRRRPQDTSRQSASLGRRSGADASFSFSKRGFGSMRAASGSSMNRSFSSKSFFSTRTFGTVPEPETTQRSCTDIDLIACMARNLVESASPIRPYDEDDDTVDYDRSHSYSYRYYERKHRYYERNPSDDYEDSDELSYDSMGGDVSSKGLAMMDITDIEDRMAVRALKDARSKRRQLQPHSNRHALRAEIHHAAYATRESPRAVPGRLDRALQDCYRQQNLSPSAAYGHADRLNRPSQQSLQSGISSGSVDAVHVPNWLVSAIRVSSSGRSTPNKGHTDLLPEEDEEEDYDHEDDNRGEGEDDRGSWSRDGTGTDDDSDKENYLAVNNVVNFKRASTSAFGPRCPRTPSPTVKFPSSAPTSPKRAALRAETSRPAALRASWAI